MKRAVVLGLMLSSWLAGGAITVAQDKPDWPVKDLYVPLTLAEVAPEKVFAPDVAEALKADGSAATKAVAFDYRFDSPNSDAGALDFATEEVTDTRARVRADFMVKGKPRKVFYTLCKTAEGKWRIQNVSAPGKWEMRKMLKLADASAC